jgi:polysaccharide deacetylase family protein (PEP-CTERM system associated)
MKNAMTIDVEDYFHVSAFASSIASTQWDSYACRVEANTDKLLGMFSDGGIKATFFVLGWVAERYPALVRSIAVQGHEIACHGYSHRLVYDQTPREFREETQRSKRVLEDLVQTPVLGYRAASYSITSKSLWALDILVELGFAYDSSIFPVRHDRYGIPGGSRQPYRLGTPSGGSLVEFPLTTVELGRYRLPVSGGGYFRLFPYLLTRMALASVNGREQRPFIFYLHPWEVDPDQPRVKSGWLSRFRHYNNLERCEPRLRQLLADFEFGTAAEVLQGLGLGTEPARG